MNSSDYSLAELSRLVEENNARILSSSVRQDPADVGKIKVTLKINLEDISSIVATFERFEYKIRKFDVGVVCDHNKCNGWTKYEKQFYNNC